MSFNARIDALLTAVADDDSDAVERALQIYDVNDIVAVMAKRLLDAEAGGSSSSLAFSLTAAQLKASQQTPVTVIPAQGSNTLIVPTAFVFAFAAGGTPFNNSDLDLVYGPNDLNTIFTGLAGSSLDWYCFGTQTSGVSESGVPADMRNQPVKLAANLRGAIAAISTNGFAFGSGYAAGDTGTVDDGSPDATYLVTTVSGGVPTAVTITDGGDGYSLAAGRSASEWTTTPGGAQPGAGSGLRVNVTEVDASGSDGDGTLSGVVYYQVADLT